MRLITERSQIREVAERYRQHYGRGNTTLHDGRSTQIIQAGLDALDVETATAADVEAIIGNDWINMRCSECGKYGMPRLEVGEPADYESATAYLCPSCVAKSVETLGSTSTHEQQ